jgi:hypothetical protein
VVSEVAAAAAAAAVVDELSQTEGTRQQERG